MRKAIDGDGVKRQTNTMNLPFILSIPHCAWAIPAEWRARIVLDDQAIIEAVDFGSLEIFSPLPVQAVVASQWSRLLVDPNRNPENRGEKGVVAFSDYFGRAVFGPGETPTDGEITQLIADYHRPYHMRLSQCMQDSSFIGLIDCHSLNGIGPADAPDAGERRKDVVLSNYGGPDGLRVDGQPTTCPEAVMAVFASALRRQGFSVSLNRPYRGGYITQHYGGILQSDGRWALQIELNQDLFMAPGDVSPDKTAIGQVRERLVTALTELAEEVATVEPE